MSTSIEDEGRGRGRARSCDGCGADLVEGQRYCIECGARSGAPPPAIAERLASMLGRQRGGEAADAGGAAPADGAAAEADPAEEPAGTPGFMPSPRVAAVAVMAMLAFGVMLGSAISPLAQSAGLTTILLEVARSKPPAAEPEEEAAEPEEEVTPEPVAESSAPLLPEALPEPAPEATPIPELPPEEFPEEEGGLPEVKHVFLIVLGENGYEETFGKEATAPYLAKTLPEEGELLPNYYAVSSGVLANEIGLLSGQGPTLETAADCPNYADVVPGTVSTEGQVEGNGCVYPPETESLPTQLVAAGLSWRAYVEDIGNGPEQPTTCRHPALGTPDPSVLPAPGDAYETWRNPFVYLHSVIDATEECEQTDVGLDQLAPDLKKAEKTPTLSYIVPNACHSGGEAPCEPCLEGGEAPCEPEAPTGPQAAEEFLETVVPEIVESPAYEEGGLIAITSAQAPQVGERADPSACCSSTEYPNLPPAEATTGKVKPSGGGGRVGMLLISPFVEPGSVEEAGYYNHFSLLLTIEELLGLQALGYANEVTGFEEGVFNASSSALSGARSGGDR